MHNITLNCTVHNRCGRCNPEELYALIKEIKPDIIFEELSRANFDVFYYRQTRHTLETDAIKKYLSPYDMKHIPVDTYNLPKHYHERLYRLHDRVTSSNMIPECRRLQNVLDDNDSLMERGGFRYLNSRLNNDRFKATDLLIGKMLTVLGDDELFLIYRLEKEVIEKREIEMLTNIYNYSKEHPYNQALFFIGSGHRESIIKKIAEFDRTQETKLNWVIRDNDNYIPLRQYMDLTMQGI
jgi:hypothetical protein